MTSCYLLSILTVVVDVTSLTSVTSVPSTPFLPSLPPTLTLTELAQLTLNHLTDSEYLYGRMRGRFGVSPWLAEESSGNITLDRTGRKLGAAKGARLWPDARIPYEFADTIDFSEWSTMQSVFNNISSLTNLHFVPRTARDTDYLLITEDIDEYGCGCCSIGLGFLAGSGAHILVLAPVAKGGCGVNQIGGTHELLHILGLSHVQNRPDRCNYIDVRTDLLTGWGEWRVSQGTGVVDWFKFRIPYDCSSYVHYYQLQGAFWRKEVEEQVDLFMEQQGCEMEQRGGFINKCLVEGGHTEGNRVVKEGYEMCLDRWGDKHKNCVNKVIKRFPTFNPVDPNGRCKANGINRSKRKLHEISQWDVWALNVAYGGPLPPCQYKDRVGNGKCDSGNNNVGCDYDGGDCCLPEADPRDCIDPCGVRLKFYGGGNRPCRKAPGTKEFCSDHYWYGPNKCGKEYCRATDEKYLQWQCKNTCGLCNKDPSQKEMDKICDSYISLELRGKYIAKKQEGKGKEKVLDRQSKPSIVKPLSAKKQNRTEGNLNKSPKQTTTAKSSQPSKQVTAPSIKTVGTKKPTTNVKIKPESKSKSKPSKLNQIKKKNAKKSRKNGKKINIKKNQPSPNKTNKIKKSTFFKIKENSRTSSILVKETSGTLSIKINEDNSSIKSEQNNRNSSIKVKETNRNSSMRIKKTNRNIKSSSSENGFVIASEARRKQLRSYWTRRG